MKKFLSVFFLVSILLGSTAFASDDDIYFKVSGSVSSFSDSTEEYDGGEIDEVEFSTGMGVSVAVGKRFGAFSADVEWAYRKADIDKEGEFDIGALPITVSAAAKSLMFNGSYELDLGSPTKPYITTGIGATWMNEMDGAQFSYQAGFGLIHSLNEDLDMFGGYKYMGSDDLQSDHFEDVKFSFDTHNFEAGIRYSF